MTNLEAYIREAENQGTLHCIVPTEALGRLLDVVDEARRTANVKDKPGYKNLPPLIQGMFVGYLLTLKDALNKLDEARRG